MTVLSAPEIGVGMLGYAFMGKAHANAFHKLSYMMWPPSVRPRLVAIAGRDREKVAEASARYGFCRYSTSWQDVIGSEDVDVFDNVGPNHLHADPTIAAAETGKHVVCEKPLGRNADESFDIWQRVAATGVAHMCAFNYRFVPAVALARSMIKSGELGEIRHLRASYLQDWGNDPRLDTWRFHADEAGSGALGDLGSHLIDLAHTLVGDIASVTGAMRAFVPGRTVDDAVSSTLEFACGAIGTLEVSRLALGHRNSLCWEINGSEATLAFDLERLNELVLSRGDGQSTTLLVTEHDHPFIEHWWPPGHIIGWEHTFVHELDHFLRSIANGSPVGPICATFEDGYRAAEVCDAIVASARSGQREDVRYRAAVVATA
jgi:predicted dehydrogenase